MKLGRSFGTFANKQHEAVLRDDYALCKRELLAAKSVNKLLQPLANAVAYLQVVALQIFPSIKAPPECGDVICLERSAKQ